MLNVTIKFTRHYGSYLEGEIAAFPAGVASRLIDQGFAVEHGSGRDESASRLAKISSEVTPNPAPIPDHKDPQQSVSAPARPRPTPTEPGPDPRAKNVPSAPRTKHVPGPEKTKASKNKEPKKSGSKKK